MGRGAAPSPRRSTWASAASFLLLVVFLFCAPLSLASTCTTHCSCNITVQKFYHVSCQRETMDDIPRELPSKSFTTYLNMESNIMKILRENALDNFKQLQQLNLNRNELTYIHVKAFHQCPQLRLLQLAHNKLRSLDSKLFQENKRLQFVDLSHNKLILPQMQPFLRSSSLIILNLTATDLSDIPIHTFSEMRNLDQLELRHNLLASVDVRALEVFTKRNVTVLLSENPLHCDCKLKRTWKWQAEHLPPRQAATCHEPAGLRGLPWEQALRSLDCGEGTGGTSAGTYALYAIAGLLAVIAVLVGVLVGAVRRRRHHLAMGNAGRKRRLAPPVGEYIDVIADGQPRSEPIYDTLDPKKALADVKKDPDAERRGCKDDCDSQRYVMDVLRNTYLPPVKANDDGPIYVNMKGPPLPLRRLSDVPPSPSEPAPPAPGQAPAPAPLTAQSRPCSIPLLEGCDFYEVVD